jgi:hypothetical protein
MKNECNKIMDFVKMKAGVFIIIIIQKFDLKNKEIHIINDEGHSTLENLFGIKNSRDNNSDYLILIIKVKIDESIFNGKYEFLKNYNILYRKNDCYLLKSND